MKFKKLIISPHADDEVLGCGGVLDKDTFVFYCGINEKEVEDKNSNNRISIGERKKEIKNVSDYFNFEYFINEDNLVNNYKISKIISQIEGIINKIKPEIIFIPFPSYNQDHKTVYEAARIALRPHDRNWFVKKVLVYEQPHSILWEEKFFKVNYFITININKKIQGYLLHKSQVRDFRSSNLLKQIAQIRGASIGEKYAEAYKIERWVE